MGNGTSKKGATTPPAQPNQPLSHNPDQGVQGPLFPLNEATQSGHVEPYSGATEARAAIMALTGVDEQTAEDMRKAARAFTGSDYKSIRHAQTDKLFTDAEYLRRYREQANALEAYLQLAPKWEGGTTYRGVRNTKGAAGVPKVGATIGMQGTSSWSTALSTAKSFAGSSSNSLIYVSSTQRKGSSITGLSKYGKGENEVLVSMHSRYRVDQIKTEGSYTYVYVTEL